jgi:hypothetical protein
MTFTVYTGVSKEIVLYINTQMVTSKVLNFSVSHDILPLYVFHNSNVRKDITNQSFSLQEKVQFTSELNDYLQFMYCLNTEQYLMLSSTA